MVRGSRTRTTSWSVKGIASSWGTGIQPVFAQSLADRNLFFRIPPCIAARLSANRWTRCFWNILGILWFSHQWSVFGSRWDYVQLQTSFSSTCQSLPKSLCSGPRSMDPWEWLRIVAPTRCCDNQWNLTWRDSCTALRHTRAGQDWR